MATKFHNDDGEGLNEVLQMHENLYKNIFLLTLKYPTTKEFKAYFKMDMFMKNNKAAFQHVTHFLLNVYDPVKLKENVVWPILDPKMEVQFRNQVLKYINEIRILHEESEIPPLVASHLISPAGFKFVLFMFRLSDFVLFQVISASGTRGLLLRPKYVDDQLYSRQLQDLQTLGAHITKRVARKLKDFDTKCENFESMLANLRKKTSDLQVILNQTNGKIKDMEDNMQEFIEQFVTVNDKEENANENIMKIDEIVESVKKVSCNISSLKRDNELEENLDLIETLENSREPIVMCQYSLGLLNKNLSKHVELIKHEHDKALVNCEKNIKSTIELQEYITQIENIPTENGMFDTFEKDRVLSEKITEIFSPLDL